MRQINFLMIFAVCLALVLFSLQNTEPVGIQLVQGVQVQAPLCIELLIAMGVGAILAWLFSIWSRLLRGIESGRQLRLLRQKDERIHELEQDFERYKAEVQEQQNQPLTATLETQDAETKNGETRESLPSATEQKAFAQK